MGRPLPFRVEPAAPPESTRAPPPGPADDSFARRIVVEGAFPAGAWLGLDYAADPAAPPARPALRFLTPSGPTRHALMPAPFLGRGRWLGPVPGDAHAILLDPGTPSLRIERVERLDPLAVFAAGFARMPLRALEALRLRFVAGDPRRAANALRIAAGVTPLSAYARWAAARTRPLALDPAADSAEGRGSILLVLPAPGDDGGALARTQASLRAQTRPDWRLVLVGPGGIVDDARTMRIGEAPGALLADLLAPMLAGDGSRPAAVGFLAPGDALAPDALAALAAFLPPGGLVYADEFDAHGAPRLKPGWSPDLALATGYPGRAALFDAALVLAAAGARPVGPSAEIGARLALDAFAAVAPQRVRRLPRALLTRGIVPEPQRATLLADHLARAASPVRVAAADGAAHLVWPLPSATPRASVVVPSRDRLDLIARSARGVLAETPYPDLELVIVDNASTDPAVLRFYDELRADPRVRVVPFPHAFNFSAMVNAGVAASSGSVVVLLNNDIAVLHPDWLDALVRQACREEVGAVGAKLLYPDRHLQHAGVVVGLGGYAGHVLRRRPADAPGHLDRLRVAHEVSAVTAACLAVTRDKYDAVGGLDAEAFPIDFNDVDFCLRLGARGWRTIWTPRAVLTHYESVSRGAPKGAERLRFEAEAERFAARWRAVIRDDPYFHPAFSTTTFGEELE